MRETIVIITALLALTIGATVYGATLNVGEGFPYNNVAAAAVDAVPGDSIVLHNGMYAGGQFLIDLQGTANDWITICAAESATPIIHGGTEALHFSNAAYVRIKGITVEMQTGNGVNIDDGGTFDTPTHHIIVENCVFRDMDANGNNDLLKLSGLDDFEVIGCTFLNGAEGGSGIDMVGCHNGIIRGNTFTNMGSSGIQAKGGTQFIRIEGNLFRNGGRRSLNLGGSTGLQFFRPQDAEFEAADLQAYSNIFIGSTAPIAYVGSVRVEVINNTIVNPENWVIRVLQETVDPNRFLECGDNVFRNNIVYLGGPISRVTNIGPNTRPETFTLSNNLWFHALDAEWAGPDLPAPETDALIGRDPLFADLLAEDFSLLPQSPAIGLGFPTQQPQHDFAGVEFADNRSIGALEGNPSTGLDRAPIEVNTHSITIFPNPFTARANVRFRLERPAFVTLEMTDMRGLSVHRFVTHTRYNAGSQIIAIDIRQTALPAGMYVIRLIADGRTTAAPAIVIR